MIIKANEINKYFEIHGVDKIPVEVVNTEVPECKELRQGARKLAKRLIITGAHTNQFGGRYGQKAIEAVRINYSMYNSFKKSQCLIPPDWEIDVLTNDLGVKMITEYNEHGGNLEQKFRDAFAKHNPEIQAKLEEAAKLISEAEKLSEDHGIPFQSPTGGLLDGSCHGYFPASFNSIYGDLLEESPDLVDQLTGVYRYEENGDGWQSSAGTC